VSEHDINEGQNHTPLLSSAVDKGRDIDDPQQSLGNPITIRDRINIRTYPNMQVPTPTHGTMQCEAHSTPQERPHTMHTFELSTSMFPTIDHSKPNEFATFRPFTHPVPRPPLRAG
jgi:hypothetical protein